MPRRSLGALGDPTARTSAFWVILARRGVAVRTPPWCDRGLITQRNTWHCEKLRDVALTKLTQCNNWMKRDAKKSATWSSENGTFRGENTLRYDSQWHCEKLRDVAHSNVTQRNIWIKRDATKPAAWFSANITLRGEKYVTLRQHYIVSKISGNMDLSLWRHCLVSAIFFRIESEATNVTSPGIHDKCCWLERSSLEWISFISHFIMNGIRLLIHTGIRVNPCQWKVPMAIIHIWYCLNLRISGNSDDSSQMKDKRFLTIHIERIFLLDGYYIA